MGTRVVPFDYLLERLLIFLHLLNTRASMEDSGDSDINEVETDACNQGQI